MANECSENYTRCLEGKLYYAFTPELIARRRKCQEALQEFNNSTDLSRRRRAELWRRITGDQTPLPPKAATEAEDDALLEEEPWIEPPLRMDYGHVQVGKGSFLNYNTTIIDTCLVKIGDRVMFAPNVSLYSGKHPLDPDVRNGLKGPEDGAEIHIEDDCWIGGNAIILPGVTIGKGSTVGAGSVVTKSVPPYTCVAGNPARKIKDVPQNTNAAVTSGALDALERDRRAGRGGEGAVGE